jgi:hypothetical protein
MQRRWSIRRAVEKAGKGVNVQSQVNAEVAVNTGGRGHTTSASSHQSAPIVQTHHRAASDRHHEEGTP